MMPEEKKFALVCNLRSKTIWELIEIKYRLFEALCLVHELIKEKEEALRG